MPLERKLSMNSIAEWKPTQCHSDLVRQHMPQSLVPLVLGRTIENPPAREKANKQEGAAQLSFP